MCHVIQVEIRRQYQTLVLTFHLLETGFPGCLSIMVHQSSWPMSFWGSTCLCFHLAVGALGLQTHATVPGFCTGSGESNSSPHPSAAITLLAEPSPQASAISFLTGDFLCCPCWLKLVILLSSAFPVYC